MNTWVDFASNGYRKFKGGELRVKFMQVVSERAGVEEMSNSDFGLCGVCRAVPATRSVFRMHGRIAIAVCDSCIVPIEPDPKEGGSIPFSYEVTLKCMQEKRSPSLQGVGIDWCVYGLNMCDGAKRFIHVEISGETGELALRKKYRVTIEEVA